jgi:hypothetical protein
MWILLALALIGLVVVGRRVWRRPRDPTADFVSPAWLQAAIRERRH